MSTNYYGGVGGGSTEDSGGALDAADASPFNDTLWEEESAFWGSSAERLDSKLPSASVAPSDVASDSNSKRTFSKLPRLRAEVAGAGVATQPPGGAGVLGGNVFAREIVDGGVGTEPTFFL